MWQRNSSRVLVVVMLAMSLVVAACAGDGSSDTTAGDVDTDTTAGDGGTDTTVATETTAGVDGEPIRIGASLGLTGSFSGPSEHYRILYEAAVEEINEEGGLLGRPVELILYDDESTQETAQGLYQRLINDDEADLLLAPYTTFIGGSVLPVVRQSGLLLVNAGFVGTEIARQYDRIFMVWPFQEPNWTRSFFEMIDGLPEDQQPSSLAVFTAQNPFTIMERDGFEGVEGVLNYADERGIDVVVEEEYPADASDLTGLVRNAQDAGAEALVLLGLPNDSALMANTIAEVGWEPTLFCACGSSVTTFPLWDDLSPEASNGVFSIVPAWEADEPEQFPGLDTVVQIFQEEGFDEMPAYGPVAYAAVQVMRQAVEATGSTDGAELAEYIGANEFQTATGTLAFDENGISEFSGALVQYVDGDNVLVWPEDRAEADPVVPRP